MARQLQRPERNWNRTDGSVRCFDVDVHGSQARPSGTGGTHLRLSIVIPVLNEGPGLADRLPKLCDEAPRGTQIIVVDGGSRDDSLAVARRHATTLEAPRGRAIQLNHGAAATTGRVLLFLHADVDLPAGWHEEIRAALRDARVVAGGFLVEANPRSRSLDLITAMSNLRARTRRRFYGDQAIFVRADVFHEIGGFNESMPLFEGYDLTRRLQRVGRVACVPRYVRASSRRFIEHGVWRTFLAFHYLKLRYLITGLPGRSEHLYPPPSEAGIDAWKSES